MLPNVRLMIAGTFASIVALICGFGLFAAFQVSHEPLARLPSAGPPRQLIAANAASALVTAAEPFDDRLRAGQPEGGSDAALAYSAVQPAEAQGIGAAAPPADQRENASEPQQLEVGADTLSTPALPLRHKIATAEEAEEALAAAAAAAPSQQNLAPSAAPETEPDGSAEFVRSWTSPSSSSAAASELRAAEPSVAAAPPAESDVGPRAADSAAAAEPPANQPAAAEPTTARPATAELAAPQAANAEGAAERIPPTAETTQAATAPASPTSKTVEHKAENGVKTVHKKAKRSRLAARVRRRARAAAVGQAETQSADQNLAFAQSSFQTAPPQPQWLQTHPATSRRSEKLTSRTSQESNGVGRAFFSGPNQ